MTDRSQNQPSGSGERRAWRLPDACSAMVQQLFVEASSERWQLSFQSFYAALTRGASKRFGETAPAIDRIQEYFATLHVRDLALACACCDGAESAWNDFVAEFRGYLRVAAAAILRRPSEDPSASDLAASLFPELYRITGGKPGGRS